VHVYILRDSGPLDTVIPMHGQRTWRLCKQLRRRGMRILFIFLPACGQRSRPKFAADDGAGLKCCTALPDYGNSYGRESG